MIIYSCPIHCDVQSDRPITCSRCGMKLEPRDEERPSTTSSRTGPKQPIRAR